MGEQRVLRFFKLPKVLRGQSLLTTHPDDIPHTDIVP